MFGTLETVIVMRWAVSDSLDDAEAVMMIALAVVLNHRRQQMQTFAEDRNGGEDGQQNTAQISSIL